MGSITDRFNNVSEQAFRAAISSPGTTKETMEELRDAVAAFLVRIELMIPKEAPPVVESEWMPPTAFPVKEI